MSSHKISNASMLNQRITTVTAAAARDRHRALIVLTGPSDGALRDFAAAFDLPFTSATHVADRADRITEILGCEFDILIHETHDDVDAGLLAALAGTVKAGGVLVLGLPLPRFDKGSALSISHFNQRFARLLSEMVQQFPDKVQWLQCCNDSSALTSAYLTAMAPSSPCDTADACRIPAALVPTACFQPTQQSTAHAEQNRLLRYACDYLESHSRGCMTITGRRGRGKSALLGQIADWLNTHDMTFAVTAARRSALASLHRHSTAACHFIAPAEARLSGCQVLLVDEASSLPISRLEGFLETHEHVIYCSTVEGYENAGRAFALRFGQLLKQHHPHALALQPRVPWRWDEGDPLEHLIDTLLMGGNHRVDMAHCPAPGEDPAARQLLNTGNTVAPPAGHTRLLDRGDLALDENLLRQVYGLLRDTHYQTSAADLSHLMDAPNLQLWVLEEGVHIKAALLLVLEGNIDISLHEAIVCKQRRLLHQLLPQLLAQTANQAQALEQSYARIIRISVAGDDRRRGLGSHLLRAVESAIMAADGPASGIGASFASDTISIAFWQQNGYTRFHTGFKDNPRTGKPAIAVIKSCHPSLESLVQKAVAIHSDNQNWLNAGAGESSSQPMDTELLCRFARGERSVHDTYAALSRLAQQHQIPLHHNPEMPRRQYEAALRESVRAILQ